MEEHIESAGDAPLFSTFDGNNGYWQIKVDKSDK